MPAADDGEREEPLPSLPGVLEVTPPPPGSGQLESWLTRLRDRLRGRLFGGSDPGMPARRPPARDPEEAGAALPDRVGRYEVLGRLGSGGMGIIYSAYDPSLDRRVAVKLLNPAGSGGEQGRARLLREAQALARLSHPSVVHVYEVGTWESQVFVAMELVQGVTLRAWQSQPDRTWRQVLAAYVAAGEGLAAAHRSGIVHRDFKPDNVLVGADGDVRVIDFGLARTELDPTAEGRPLEPSPSLDAPLTRTGTLMGTPAYMAPEQFRGVPTDARSDQFSLAVALYEALYGYRPFAGANVHQLGASVLAGKVEPPPRYTDVPERVFRVLARALAVEPAARYPSLEALLADLPAESPSPTRWLVAAALGAVVVGVGTWSWLQARDQQARDDEIAAIRARFTHERAVVAEHRLRALAGRSRADRWNDVVLAAAERADPTETLAILKNLDAAGEDWLAPARLLAAEADERDVVVFHRHLVVDRVDELTLSADGSVVAYCGAGPEVVRDRWRAPPEVLEGLEAPVRALAMSGDATVVVAGDSEGNVVVWADGHDPVAIPAGHRQAVTAVAVSSDGRRVASSDAQGRVAVWDRERKHFQGWRRVGARVASLAFSPDGSRLAWGERDGSILLWSLDRPAPGELPPRSKIGVRHLAFGHGGTHLDCLGDDGRIWRIQLDEPRAALVPGIEGASELACADGDALAIAGPGLPLRVLPGGGAPARDLSVGTVDALAMSRDGRLIVAVDPANDLRIWRMAAPSPPRIHMIDGTVLALAESADGSRLAAGTYYGAVRVWSLDGDDDRRVGHLLGGVHDLDFSPAGDRLAAVGGLGGITVWALDGEAEPTTLSPAMTVEPPLRWSPDGGRLAAVVCDSPRRCALAVHATADGRNLLTTPLGPPVRWFGLSPGGNRAIAIRASSRDRLELYDVETGERLPAPTFDPAPMRILAHAFGPHGDHARLATRDGDTLRLWHWELGAEVATMIDERTVADVVVDRFATSMLVRTPEGDDLWSMDEPLGRPVVDLPERIDWLRLSADRSHILIGSGPRVLVVHVATGIRRVFDGVGPPLAWHGDASLVDVDNYAWVRIRRDPTPADPRAFMEWLSETTDATVAPGELR